MKKTNILIGFYDTAGVFSSLADALRTHGAKADCLFYINHEFSYSLRKSFYLRILQFVYSKTLSKSKCARVVFKVFFNVISFFFFVYAAFNYKAFILSSTGSFFFWLNGFEFKVLKKLNKKIVFVFTGTDSRPPFLSGINLSLSKDELVKETFKKLSFLSSDKFEGAIKINSPSTSLFHSGEVLDFFKIGLPKSIMPSRPRNRNSGGRIRIVHAPSNLAYKGSSVFKDIILKLKEKYEIEYIEVSGVSNFEVLELIRSADLLLDELYSDSLMAGIACESAWLGTCYLVFGEKLPEMAQAYNWPTTNFGKPSQVAAVIEEFVSNHSLRQKAANDLHSFVCENWCLKQIGEKYMRIVLGQPVDDLVMKKELIKVLNSGWGASSHQINEMTSKVRESQNYEVTKFMDEL